MLTNGELKKYRHVCICMPDYTYIYLFPSSKHREYRGRDALKQ